MLTADCMNPAETHNKMAAVPINSFLQTPTEISGLCLRGSDTIVVFLQLHWALNTDATSLVVRTSTHGNCLCLSTQKCGKTAVGETSLMYQYFPLWTMLRQCIASVTSSALSFQEMY